MQFHNQWPEWQLTIATIQSISPSLHTIQARPVNIVNVLQFHHLIVRLGHWDHREASGESRSEVTLIHLFLQRNGRSRIDEVPSHPEFIDRRIRVLIHLAILFVVESLQFHTLLIDP